MKNRARHGYRYKSSNMGVRIAVLLSVLVIVLVVLMTYIHRLDSGLIEQTRGEVTLNDVQLKRMTYNGVDYVRKPEITTMLIMGIDRSSKAVPVGYRDGGHADFLMVLVIDHMEKKVHRLAIDRDTAAEIMAISVMGKPMGTFIDHISLSHGFGGTDEERCGYTISAVENLLMGESVDLYMAVNIDKIAVFNDLLGGIEVTIDIDMTNADPEFVKGTKIVLKGDQAERFVRARMNVGDGTNSARMERQKEFIDDAMKKTRARVKDDPDFVGKIYDEIDGGLSSNISRGRLVNEANRAWKYVVGDIEKFEGVYQLDNDNYMEFFPDPDSIAHWVLKTYYVPENK